MTKKFWKVIVFMRRLRRKCISSNFLILVVFFLAFSCPTLYQNTSMVEELLFLSRKKTFGLKRNFKVPWRQVLLALEQGMLQKWKRIDTPGPGRGGSLYSHMVSVHTYVLPSQKTQCKLQRYMEPGGSLNSPDLYNYNFLLSHSSEEICYAHL